MTDPVMRILRAADARRQGRARLLIAIAGPPASGKSTLAEAVAERSRATGRLAQVVPMDGFHFDNRVLEPAGLLNRKGAPESFDLGGFTRTLAALREGGDVCIPVFSRRQDIAIAGARMIPANCPTLIVEGNYLAFDEPGWRNLAEFWDLSVRLDVSPDVLRQRLVARWHRHGLSPDAAVARVDGNDLPNAMRIARAALNTNIVISG